MGKDFQIKKINAKEEVEFHDKGINVIKTQLSQEKILTSLLTATTMKMNSKYCKPFWTIVLLHSRIHVLIFCSILFVEFNLSSSYGC